MKEIFFLIALSLCSSCFSQLSKKEVKNAYNRINEVYEKKDYHLAYEKANEFISKHPESIDARFLEILLFSAHNCNDLNKCLYALNNYSELIKDTKKEKKVSDNAKKLLNDLQAIRKIYTERFPNNNFTIKNADLYLDPILGIRSNYFLVYFQKGIYENYNRNYEASNHSLSLSLEKGNPDVYILTRIQIDNCMQMQHYSQAINHIDNLLTLYDTSEVTLKSIKVTVLSRQQKFEEAITIVDDLIDKNPTNISFYEKKADLFYYTQDYKNAVQTYRDLLTVAPSNLSAYNKLYYLSLRINDKELAFEALDNCLRLDPKNPSYWINKNRFFNKKTDYNEIIDNFDQAIKIQPNSATYYFLKGEFIFNMFNKKTKHIATNSFIQSLKFDSLNFKTYEYICRHYMWSNKSQAKFYKRKAINTFREKLTHPTVLSQDQFKLALAYDLETNGYGDGKKYADSAFYFYTEALKNGYDSSKVISKRCSLAKHLKYYDLSFQDYLYLSKTSTGTWQVNNLSHASDCLKSQGKTDENIAFIKKNLEKHPKAGGLYWRLADCYLEKNDKQSAIKTLELGHKKSPKNWSIKHKLKELK